MDEDLFREAYRDANPLDCAFQKAILNQSGRCAGSRRVCVADRQGVACEDALTRGDCAGLLARLRARSRFALQLAKMPRALSHAQEIRIQLGALRGIARLLGDGATGKPDESAQIDLASSVRSLIARYGDLDSIPYEILVAEVGAIDVRRRRRDR